MRHLAGAHRWVLWMLEYCEHVRSGGRGVEKATGMAVRWTQLGCESTASLGDIGTVMVGR